MKKNKENDILTSIREIKNVLVSHSRALHINDTDEEEFKKLLLVYDRYFDKIEAAVKSNTKKANEEQQGLVEDYIDISKKYCDLMAKYEKEHETLEILKNNLDFYFDDQKQVMSINKSNRLVRGIRVNISIDEPDKFNLLKKELK